MTRYIASRLHKGYGIQIITPAVLSVGNCGIQLINGTSWVTRIKAYEEKPGAYYLTDPVDRTTWIQIASTDIVPPLMTVGEIYQALDDAKIVDNWKTATGMVFLSDRIGPDHVPMELDAVQDLRASHDKVNYKEVFMQGWERSAEEPAYAVAVGTTKKQIDDYRLQPPAPGTPPVIGFPAKVGSRLHRMSFGVADFVRYLILRRHGSVFRGPVTENVNHPGSSAICSWIWIPDKTKILHNKTQKYNVPEDLSPHLTRTHLADGREYGPHQNLIDAAKNFIDDELKASKLGREDKTSERRTRKTQVPDIRSA